MRLRRVLAAVLFGVLSACSGEKTTAPVTVSSVSLSNSSGTLQYGQTVQLTASVLSSNGSTLTGRPLAWSSSNDAIASVSSTGLVTAGAVRGGNAETATITVTSDGKSASAVVTVAPISAATVTLSLSQFSLYIGQTTQLGVTTKDVTGGTLTGRAVAWSSASPTIATVSSQGLVTAIAAGVATVTATVDGKNTSASVTVALVPVSTVTVTPSTGSLYVGQTLQLTASAKDSAGNTLTGRTVTWSSASPTIATVSSQGLVTAIAAGVATVTATVDGKSVTTSVTVLVPLSIGVGPQIAALQLPSAQVGAAYSYRLSASGGNGMFTFSLVEGRWPAGLTLTGDGLISGVATAADSVDVRLRVSSAGLTGERVIRFLVFSGTSTGSSSSCTDVWEVSSMQGGLLSLIPPTGTGIRETCVQLPVSSSGRTLVILSPNTRAEQVVSSGDIAPPQIAYDVQSSQTTARRIGTLAVLPNPVARTPKLWTPVAVPGGAREAPTQYTWQWGINRYVPTRLVYRGRTVNYYEDTTTALAQRGTALEWGAIDAEVNQHWASMDTIFGPLADLDRDGKFAIVSVTGVAGTNAYYSACALAPGWEARDTSRYGNCGSDKTRDHAVIPVVGNFRKSSVSETANYIVGPLLHETVHARQHMLTLQVPGRGATENPCGMIPFLHFKPASPLSDCTYRASRVASTMFSEGSANAVTTLLTDNNWRYGCLHSVLSGQCNLNDEPYHSGHLFWSWLIARAGRSLWTESLYASLAASTGIDALQSVTSIPEGVWYAMFLASMMLDDTPGGERLGLHWPGIPVSARMGFASTAVQWSAHPIIGVGSYDAARLRYGGGSALRIDHTSSVTLRFRSFAGGGTATVLIIPEVVR